MSNRNSNRIYPSWEEISNFKQKLTEGELYLLNYLDENLPKDNNWKVGSRLKEYNGWLIFVQPYLNGSRPDIVVYNPFVGIQIIEVKDWNLEHYRFDNNILYVNDSKGSYPIKSPIKQVAYYKNIIISQLVPKIGDSIDKNKKAYGTIKTSVYFHNATKEEVSQLFNNTSYDNNCLMISRDMLSNNNKIENIIPDHKYQKSFLWNYDWYEDIIFWLKPPYHSIEQGVQLKLTKEQEKFAFPETGHYRVRGVAGSGKTNILAYRAANLASKGFKVLILTYNITLWHYIKDMIQRTPFSFSWDKFKFNHFHGFCKEVLNNYEKNWPSGSGDELYKKVVVDSVLDAINDQNVEKYDAILIDEGQDYYFEWYELLQQFLSNRDELVVVCDKKQNIYKRDMDWLDKRKGGRDKFGEWIELKKIFRLPPNIAELTNKFSENFGLDQEVKSEKSDNSELFKTERYVWQNIEPMDWRKKVVAAFNRLKKEEYAPSDIVIMFTDITYGKECVKIFKEKNIDSNHVFDDEDSRSNKRSFWMGDSRLKISTVHSFKGWELVNVIIYIPPKTQWPEDKLDSIIYTAMTRTRQNLIVFNSYPRYIEFGENLPDSWDFFDNK